MRLTDRRSIAYVAAAAAFVALLVIARPVINPTTVPVQQSSNGIVAPPPVVPVVDLNLNRLRSTASAQLRESERDPFRFRPKAPPNRSAAAAADPAEVLRRVYGDCA